MKLVIGNKNYSSWSFRAWFLLKQAGVAFEEEKVSLNAPDFAARVKRYSPAGRVPVLIDREIVIWDSLAIAEYVAERFPDKWLWPEPRAARAEARSICAEMHSGFVDLRNELPMNCEAQLPKGLFTKGTQRDIRRIIEIWETCRARSEHHGPFLYGAFSVADAFYAPVVVRFGTHDVPLPERARRYVEALRSLPAFSEWMEAARAELDYIDRDEPYRDAPEK